MFSPIACFLELQSVKLSLPSLKQLWRWSLSSLHIYKSQHYSYGHWALKKKDVRGGGGGRLCSVSKCLPESKRKEYTKQQQQQQQQNNYSLGFAFKIPLFHKGRSQFNLSVLDFSAHTQIHLLLFYSCLLFWLSKKFHALNASPI